MVRTLRNNPLILLAAVAAAPMLVLAGARAGLERGGPDIRVPILVYHRFGPVVADSMTVTTPVFEAHMQYLKDSGYSVIPLRQLVDHLLGTAPAPSPRSVVITVDDGHRSVYSDMLPLVLRYRLPVTVFIYPSAISRADYALTWEELREMQRTGLFEIQSHSHWHPNFKQEKKHLNPREYEEFVTAQLTRSRDKLQAELGGAIDMLAWPFGIYDDQLIGLAVKARYIAAVTLERRAASTRDNIMALPRFLITNEVRGKAFERLLSTAGGSSGARVPSSTERVQTLRADACDKQPCDTWRGRRIGADWPPRSCLLSSSRRPRRQRTRDALSTPRRTKG